MAGPQVRLRLTVRARFQVREATRWYRRQDAATAVRFVAAVRSTQQSLAEAPLRWAQFEPGFRRIRVAGLPYALIYNRRMRS